MTGDRPRYAVVVSGFPRLSETFALNELLALDAAGRLDRVYATKAGQLGSHHGAVEALASKVCWLPVGSIDEQARYLVDEIGDRSIAAVHGYFAHRPAAVAERAAQRMGVAFGFSVHAKDARVVEPIALAQRAGRARVVVACNDHVVAFLAGVGVEAVVNPHGVDTARFTPSRRPGSLTVELLAVGRLVPKKGFAVLIAAMSALPRKFRLRIIGSGPDAPALRAQIDRLGLGSRVELSGACTHDELPDAFARCSLVVVPSVVAPDGDRDGLPNVVLEAMASGRAVVASEVAAIASAVVPGVTGVLVEPHDHRMLAQAICRLAASPTALDGMEQAARRRALDRFELATCSARFVTLLEESYG